MSTRRVTITPQAGFVVKTHIESLNDTSHSKKKIFINIAFDPLIPPPPTGTEPEAISHPDYVMPLVVGDLKQDKDKKGEVCVVVDVVFSNNKSVRGKCGEEDWREFLGLIAVERVEEKHDLSLSRNVAWPNIKSKGTLESRAVVVPVFGKSPNLQSKEEGVSSGKKKPLIEEISSTDHTDVDPPDTKPTQHQAEKPSYSITKRNDGSMQLVIEMPKLTRTLAEQALLDIEPRRLILKVGSAPNYIYELDENFPKTQLSREFDVNKAKAEWIVGERHMVLTL